MFSLQSSHPLEASWSIGARRSLTGYAAQLGASDRQQADVAIAVNHVLTGLARSATFAPHADTSRTIRVSAEDSDGALDVVISDSHAERDDGLRFDRLDETTVGYELAAPLDGGIAVAMRFAIGTPVPA
jgi:hypothetical protein